ncbi:MAG: bifunctional rhamnulose-1-phosphate aldolase/short-chain dehydrogenase, partial [Cytophagaceae bacterium]
HLHPDALIAIAASRDGEAIMHQIWGNQLAWLPWQRPGFDLGLKLEETVRNNPNLRGVILGGHGLFTWGNTSYESYINTLEVIEQASEYLAANYGKKRAVFGGPARENTDADTRKKQAASLMPVLRGLASGHRRMVGHFTDDERVLEFVNSHDLPRLARLGTSCPDHFLRTKIRPLVLDPIQLSSADSEVYLEKAFADYRDDYAAYYERNKHDNSPAIRDPNPVVILWPAVGMFTFAKDKQTARVAAEFYTNAINVMKGAEAVSDYVGLPEQEAFDIEYWLLEEAKLQRMPKPKPLSGKVALITGSAGGIGKAIAKTFLAEGAVVIINDNDADRLASANEEFKNQHGKYAYTAVQLDVTNSETIANAYSAAALAFGGVDIVVNCAGLSISKPIEEHTESDWDLLYDVLVKGQFLVTQQAVAVMRKQKLGG